MITDEKLVDALDSFRQSATPAVLEWTRNVAQAANEAKRGGSQEDVAEFQALAELARVVAESGK